MKDIEMFSFTVYPVEWQKLIWEKIDSVHQQCSGNKADAFRRDILKFGAEEMIARMVAFDIFSNSEIDVCELECLYNGMLYYESTARDPESEN